MTKLILKGSNGDPPIAINISPDAEQALYDMVKDLRDPMWAPRQINELSTLVGYMSVLLHQSGHIGGLSPYYISQQACESILILPSLFRFFNHLSISPA